MKKQGWKFLIKGQKEHCNHSPAHFPGRTTEDVVVAQMRRLLGFPRRHHGVTEIMAGALFFSAFVSYYFVSDVSDFVCFPLLLGVYVEVFHIRIIICLVQFC